MHIVKYRIALCENEVSINHLLILVREPILTVKESVRYICLMCRLNIWLQTVEVLIVVIVKFGMLQVLIVCFRAIRLPQTSIGFWPYHHIVGLSGKVTVGMSLRDCWVKRCQINLLKLRWR